MIDRAAAAEPKSARKVQRLPGHDDQIFRHTPRATFTLLAGCAHENDDTMTPTTRMTSGTQMAAPVDRHSVDELAKARCDREQACTNVGAGKTYATRDVCMEKLHADNENDLTNANCPNGSPARPRSTSASLTSAVSAVIIRSILCPGSTRARRRRSVRERGVALRQRNGARPRDRVRTADRRPLAATGTTHARWTA